MTENFLRACTLQLSGASSSTVVTGGGLTDLRVQFQVESHTLQSPNLCVVVITNPSSLMVTQVQNEFTAISLSAGYANGFVGPIFSGTITEIQFGEKTNGFTDELLRIYAVDGDTGYNQARVSTTLGAGASYQDMFDVCLKAMAPFGITMGSITGIDLSQPKFPRGITMAGMSRDYLREIALSNGATFNIQNNQLNIIGKNSKTAASPIILSASNGLIYQPIQRQDGVIARCLINPAIGVDTNIQLDSKVVTTVFKNSGLAQYQTSIDQQSNFNSTLSSNNLYRVLHLVIDGDTRGAPWEMTLTLGLPGDTVNAAQAGLGYS